MAGDKSMREEAALGLHAGGWACARRWLAAIFTLVIYS